MTEGKKKWMLWAALIISIAAYQLWEYIPTWEFNGVERKPYYIAMALFIAILCLFILVRIAVCFVTITLAVLSCYNLLGELFFNPGEYNCYEWSFIVVLSIGLHALKKVREFDEISKI